MKDCALCGGRWAAHEAPLFHCGLPTAHIALPPEVEEAIEAGTVLLKKEPTIEDLGVLDLLDHLEGMIGRAKDEKVKTLTLPVGVVELLVGDIREWLALAEESDNG